MTIIVNFIVLPLIVVLSIALVACIGILCYGFAYTVFLTVFTAEDIVTYTYAYGYPDRRGIRVSRFNVSFLNMKSGEQWGDEYYINQMEYDAMTR